MKFRAIDGAGNVDATPAQAAWRSVTARVELCGDITSDKTLSPDDALVYAVTCGVRIAPTASLIVDTGAVLKASPTSAIAVDGRLVADGTAESPVTFTSLRDDSVGGDSANDGATTPAPDDWEGITVMGPQAHLRLNGARVQYASKSLQASEQAGIELNHSRFDRGVSITNTDRAALIGVAITNPNGVALSVYGSSVTVNAGSITNAATAIDSDADAHVAYRGTIKNLSGDKWVRACRWSQESDCGIDASYVDWGPEGPAPTGQPSRVCGQVLVDPWIGVTSGNDVFRTPNCDGSTYRPDQQVSDASSYANQRLAEVYATCDPDDPITADACAVYERFQSCYAAALDPAKSGSTFPIPSTPEDVATGLATSLSDGLASSPDPFIAGDGQLFQRLTGLLQVVGIASSLVNAYRTCAP